MKPPIVITKQEILQEIEEHNARREAAKKADPEFWWAEWAKADKGWQRCQASRAHEPFVMVWLKRRKDGGFKVRVKSGAKVAGKRIPCPIDLAVDYYNADDELGAKVYALRMGRWLVHLLSAAPSWEPDKPTGGM